MCSSDLPNFNMDNIMKKTLITILLMLSLAIPNTLFAYPPMPMGWMTLIPSDLSAIDSPADTEVPSYDSATGKFEWIASGSGDVTAVGNCATGACLDGTDDGGTQILFYDAQGATTLAVGDNAGAVALTLPNATGTLTTAAEQAAAYQPLLATLTDIADGTITENLVNTAKPWADNEVADTLTIGAGSTIGAVASGTMTGYPTGAQPLEATLTDIADGTINENLVNTANPWAVNEGGSGAATFTDGGILLGATTGAFEVTAAGGVGELLVGVAASNPKWLATSTAGYKLTNNGAADPSWVIPRELQTLAFTNDATQTTFTAANMLLYGSFSNKGDNAETDIILDAPSYPIKITALVEYAAVMEICPPSGEQFDLNNYAVLLTQDFCIESPAIIGSKAVFTRMYSDTLTAWFWSVDTVRGAWIDGGDTGD